MEDNRLHRLVYPVQRKLAVSRVYRPASHATIIVLSPTIYLPKNAPWFIDARSERGRGEMENDRESDRFLDP